VMHLDERPGDRQTQSEAAFRAVERALVLHEQVEDARQQVGRNTDAGIADAERGLVGLCLQAHRDRAAARGVLAGVVEQVRQGFRMGTTTDSEWGQPRFSRLLRFIRFIPFRMGTFRMGTTMI
jgi:hypothetical protein